MCACKCIACACQINWNKMFKHQYSVFSFNVWIWPCLQHQLQKTKLDRLESEETIIIYTNKSKGIGMKAKTFLILGGKVVLANFYQRIMHSAKIKLLEWKVLTLSFANNCWFFQTSQHFHCNRCPREKNFKTNVYRRHMAINRFGFKIQPVVVFVSNGKLSVSCRRFNS